LPAQPWGGEVHGESTVHRVTRRGRETAGRIAAFARILPAVRPDLIHLQTDVARHVDPFLLRAVRRPIVITIHNAVPHEDQGRERQRLRRLWRGADALIVHSEQARADVEPLAPGIPVFVVPVDNVGPGGGVDRADARRRLDLGDRPTALVLGLVRPYKGIGLLRDAWAKVAERLPEARLLVVGQLLEPFDELDELAALPGVTTRLGWLGEDEFDTWAAAADVMLLPYAHGAHSAVLHRSIANGTPVLASPPLGDETTRLGAGRVVPLEPGAWADAVVAALGADPMPRPSLRPDGGATARAVIAAYESVLVR
jgi:glycosyltransferase involved in cell wall biosynthesis